MVQVKKRSEKGNVIIRADQIGDRCYTGKSWNKTEEKIDGVTIHYMAKFDKAGKITHVTDYKFKKEGFMNKFIYKNASDITSHWELCNQNKYPFITINNIDRNFNEIFFDITNISNKLEEVSNSIKEISSCYNKFFLIPDYITERYESQYYYFEFPVINTHSELIANQLFDYLLDNIS